MLVMPAPTANFKSFKTSKPAPPIPQHQHSSNVPVSQASRTLPRDIIKKSQGVPDPLSSPSSIGSSSTSRQQMKVILNSSSPKNPLHLGSNSPGSGKAKAVLSESEVFKQIEATVTPGNPKKLYTIIETLGHGASGIVSLAEEKDSRKQVAIKAMDFKPNMKKSTFLNELKVLTEIKHPNLVNFYNSYLVRDKRTQLWLVMEVLDGGSLTNLIFNRFERDRLSLSRGFDERVVAYVCREVLKAINHLHSNNVIHRDIKSDNVLTNMKGEIKLSKCNDRNVWINL